MQKESKIFVAGHRGLVGSAILRCLKSKGYNNIVTRTHNELDLTNTKEVADFFNCEKPLYVFLAAAKVGGIMANCIYRGEFIYENMMIQNNVIHQSYIHGVEKLLFLGSTCIYPKNAPQPMNEESLLTSPLEYTNEPYAIAKIAGIKMCESYNIQYGTNYMSVMPTNLYGPNDNFNLESSHVLPALIRKIYLGKCLMNNDIDKIKYDLNVRPIESVDGNSDMSNIISLLSKYGITSTHVEIWGDGTPLREFLWSEDMADASIFVMEDIDWRDMIKGKSEIRNCHINIGSGKEITIKELSNLISRIIGYRGNIIFNTSKPNGTPRKLTDTTLINSLGWQHNIDIEEGVEKLFNWYIS